MNNYDKKPVVLFLVDGFGLSTAWEGNAIAAANPENFNKLWQEYRHLAIKQPISSSRNSHSNYELISSGKDMILTSSSVNLLDNEEVNAKLANVFESLRRNNGSIHLFTTLSKNDTSGMKNLLDFVDLTKQGSIVNTIIHFFVDDSFENKTQLEIFLTEISSKLEKINFGTIGTVTGLNFVKSENYQKIIDAIYFAKSKSFFTIKQALTRKKQIAPSELEPTVLKTSFETRVKDFDLIALPDSPSDIFTDFIKNLMIRNKSVAGRFPKFLKFLSFVEFPIETSEKIIFLHQKNKEAHIINQATNNQLSQVLICDQQNLRNLNLYLLGNRTDIEQRVIQNSSDDLTAKITQIATKTLEEKLYDFIIINHSSLNQRVMKNSYEACVLEIQKIDHALKEVADLVLKMNGYLIFVSPFGGAERLVDKSKSLRDNQRSFDKKNQILPFFIVSNSTKNLAKSDLFQEIIQSNCDLTTVYKFLETLLVKVKGTKWIQISQN